MEDDSGDGVNQMDFVVGNGNGSGDGGRLGDSDEFGVGDDLSDHIGEAHPEIRAYAHAVLARTAMDTAESKRKADDTWEDGADDDDDSL